MACGRGPGTELKQHFVTKEGCYRVMELSEYCRPTKIPYTVQQCHPVRLSFISVKEQGGCNDRIAFNVGRELYYYIYKGVRKVGVPSSKLSFQICRLKSLFSSFRKRPRPDNTDSTSVEMLSPFGNINGT